MGQLKIKCCITKSLPSFICALNRHNLHLIWRQKFLSNFSKMLKLYIFSVDYMYILKSKDRSFIRTKKDLLPVAIHFNGNNHRWVTCHYWLLTITSNSMIQIKTKRNILDAQAEILKPHGINKMVDLTRMNIHCTCVSILNFTW
jgi:hypothetical protein